MFVLRRHCERLQRAGSSPVYHRLEDRIRAHVLPARIAETRAAATWPRARDELQSPHEGTITGPAGRAGTTCSWSASWDIPGEPGAATPRHRRRRRRHTRLTHRRADLVQVADSQQLDHSSDLLSRSGARQRHRLDRDGPAGI